MPSLNFPTPTTVGEQYLDWVWNGVGWDSLQTLPGGLPAGSIIQWGGATAPVNWLLCDGSAVSRTTYASLFAAVGTSYGVGDGSTTFNLPDLRGRVPVGKNGGSFGTLGATGGAETVTLTEAQMPSHTHTFSGSTNTTGAHTHSLSGSNGGSVNLGPSVTSNSNGDFGYTLNGGRANSAGDHSHTFSGTTAGTGGGQAHNNLQPYQVVNYIIKATAAVTPGESELAPRVGQLEQNPNITGTLTVAGNTAIGGRLTVPNQPAFSATASYGTNYSGVLPTVIYQFTDVNNGNHYSTSTGRFTAPVAGTYFFSAQAHRNGQTGFTTLRLRKNGVLFSNSWSTGGSGAASDGMTTSGIAYLAANDYVYVEMDTSQTNYIAESYWKFIGHLIG